MLHEQFQCWELGNWELGTGNWKLILARRAQLWIREKFAVGEALQERDQVIDLRGCDLEPFQPRTLHRTLGSTAGVVTDHFSQGRDAAVVHIRAR